MKHIRSVIFSKPFLLFFIIAQVYIVLSNIALIRLTAKNQSDTIFPYHHRLEAISDYNLYLSIITQGKNGFWLMREPYTTEPTTPGIFYFYYIAVGKLSSIFHLWQPLAYHIARIVTVEIYIVSLYVFSLIFLPKKIALWGSFFSIMLTISPHVLIINDTRMSVSSWWLWQETLERLNGLPHHLFGQSFLLFAISFLFLFFKTKRLVYTHLTPVCNFLCCNSGLDGYIPMQPRVKEVFLVICLLSVITSGITLPPSLLAILLALPLSFCLYTVGRLYREKKLLIEMDLVIPIMLVIVIAAFTLSISIVQSKLGFPWSMWNVWEQVRWNSHEPHFNYQFFSIFLLILLFSFPAVYYAFKKNIFEMIFLSLWAYLPFALLPFVGILGIGKIRLLATIPTVPFALLITIFMFKLLKNQSLKIILITFLIVSSLGVTLYSAYKSYKQAEELPFYTNLYMPRSTFESIVFMQKNVPVGSHVLSNEFVGNIIPAYVPAISYFGHINQTNDFFGKQSNIASFYTHHFSESEALKFLNSNGITFVYYGKDEKLDPNKDLSYPFLKPIYTNQDVTIFRIRD